SAQVTHSPSSSFFYCYGAHRHLHSFPTRRSSDLEVHDHGRPVPVQPAQRETQRPAAAGDGELADVRVHAREQLVGLLGPHAEAEDRKSTRLNSSHSQISYAVFCLKKKKKKVKKSK